MIKKHSRFLAVLLSVAMTFTMIPTSAFAAETEEPVVTPETEETEPVIEEEQQTDTLLGAGTKLDTSNLTYDITDPDGYVTVSFADNGVRPDDAVIDNEELYGTAVGTIIGATEVPYEEGDNVAEVTVRLLDAMGLAYESTGTVEDGFYLAGLKDFELNGTYYPTFSEFDAGSASGWCVRLNNWHINQGTSAFTVEDGDVINWLYTCQYGADIGADYSTKSAEITGVTFTDSAFVLDPVFNTEEDAYTVQVEADITSVAFEVALENYASVVSVTVDGVEVNYRPNKSISVTNNSNIEISTTLEYMDAANNNEVSTYTDKISIQLAAPSNQCPVVSENALTSLDATAGEQISVDFANFFEDADGDTLTYTLKIEALGLDQTLTGSVFEGTIPTEGTYEAVITASDGKESVSHTVTINVTEAAANTAPNIKSDYADTKGKTYVYSSSYVYIYMDDIFEDADGDTLTYKATCDGEEVAITYNSWSKQYYIQFAQKPIVKEYKIWANDGKADSEVFTAKCIGTSATITAPEDSPLIAGGNYYYYVKGTAAEDTFALNYSLDVDENLVPTWMSSNAALTNNGDGTFTVGDVTSRTQLYVGLTYGKDGWGSDLYLGTKYIYLLPAMPEVADITAELAEHADNQTATVVTNAFAGWYNSEFDYTIEDPSICDLATTGSYGLSVTPKALGTTKVTATFKHDASISCTFNVTVTGHSLQIKDQPGIDSVVYEKDKTVQMEVLGVQEGETFTWTSSNADVAAVDENGLVTVKGLGTSYITATSSLSTDDVPVKASMYLQVKEDGKVYLEDLAMTDYSYFDGFISAKSAFNSATLEYDWNLNESRYTYNKLAFTPTFDDEALDAVLYYTLQGGTEQSVELTSGKAVSITNGLLAGDNTVTIKVYPTEDESNVTTYTFHIFRPYNPSNTITRMTVYPNGETALKYPKYLENVEGTLFQYDAENDELKLSTWNQKPLTGWSSTEYAYKMYLFNARTDSVTLMPTFSYTDQRAMIYVDGVEFEEAITSWKTGDIPIHEGTTEIKIHVNSEKYHTEQVAAGVEDPFETPENIYTIYVETVNPLGIDSKILSAELSVGEFYQPGFDSDTYTISALLPADTSSSELTFTVPTGIDVYKTSVSDANKLTPTETDEDGNNVYVTETLAITGSGSYAYKATDIILQVTDENGDVGTTQYTFTMLKRGTKDVYPDSVVEYLCLGSQYTNYSNYGTFPERTLKANGEVLSLGNFGGYITYKYDTPIENNPNNPYGVDFVIYGNSFGNGAHEPGYVQVSEDGSTWYTLAGSEHFDDHNDWGYTMTYTNENGKSSWTNSDGESGTIYNYPAASAYPYYNWTEEAEQSLTVSGYRLNSSAKDAYGSAAAVLPVFGYVDVNTNGTINGVSNNPYNHPGTLVNGGDMFDLDWAVDDNGMPVELDSISYIRVATASSIYAGAIGEKSTEVTTVNRVTNTAESAVGETQAPASITVNGEEITVPANGKTLYLSKSAVEANGADQDAALVINVTADESANIYINNLGANERSYATMPVSGIVRIIVQQDEQEPYICYLILDEEADAFDAAINAIGKVTLSDETAIKAAREAYDALTEEQKALVTNYDTLVSAEKELKTLKTAKKNQTAANKVIKSIKAIGKVTLSDEAAITKARKAYNSLTKAQKKLVTNYKTLTAAEKELKALKAAATKVVKSIKSIGKVTLSDEAAIKKARKAYNALNKAQKKLVTNYKTLTAAEKKLKQLKAEEAKKGTWLKDSTGWWYRHNDGTYTTNGWEKIDGKWYAFNSVGYMLTGWYYNGGHWYYLSSSGAMVTGWLQLGNTWYYLSSSGAMVTGTQTINGKVYRFASSGAWIG